MRPGQEIFHCLRVGFRWRSRLFRIRRRFRWVFWCDRNMPVALLSSGVALLLGTIIAAARAVGKAAECNSGRVEG